MRVITANIGRKASVQHTRADFATIKALKGICGYQEIDEADGPPEHDLLKAVLGGSNTLVGMEHHVPISLPKKFDVINSHTVFATSGVPKYSPARFFTVAIVRQKKTLIDRIRGRNHKAFVVINTHYPAGGYHGERPEAAAKQLRTHWDEQFAVHKKLIEKYVDRGYTVFWTGDVNRTTMPKVHPREVRVVTVGIDSVSYVEGNIKVKVIRKGSAKLFSDHNAQYADFKLTYE